MEKKIKLSKEIIRNKTIFKDGKEEQSEIRISEVKLNLNNITGRVLVDAEQSILSQGLYYNIASLDSSIPYQTEIAAEIIEPKLSSNEILNLPVRDFRAITGVVRAFLDNLACAEQLETLATIIEQQKDVGEIKI